MRLDLSVADAEVLQDGVDLYWGIEVEEPQSEQVTELWQETLLVK